MSEDIASLLDQLRKIVRTQKTHSLLSPIEQDQFSGLYWFLEDYDRRVSEQVFRALQGETYLEVIEENAEIEKPFTRLIHQSMGKNNRILKKYLDYYSKLKETENILARLTKLYRFQNSNTGQSNQL